MANIEVTRQHGGEVDVIVDGASVAHVFQSDVDRSWWVVVAGQGMARRFEQVEDAVELMTDRARLAAAALDGTAVDGSAIDKAILHELA